MTQSKEDILKKLEAVETKLQEWQDCYAGLFRNLNELQQYCAQEKKKKDEEIAKLKAHIRTLQRYAAEAAELNDKDNIQGHTVKAHKLLLALAGHIPSYEKEITEALQAGAE